MVDETERRVLRPPGSKDPWAEVLKQAERELMRQDCKRFLQPIQASDPSTSQTDGLNLPQKGPLVENKMEREVEYKQHKAPKIVISSEEGDHVGVHRTFTDLELDGIRKTIEAAGKVNTNLRLLIGEYQAFRNKARIDNQGRTASGGSPVVAQHVPEAAHLNKEDQLIVLCQKLNDFRLDNKDWQYKCWKAESELRFQVKRNTKLINEVVGVEYGHASELNDLTQVFLARLNRIHWNWACFMLFVVLTLIIFGGHHG